MPDWRVGLEEVLLGDAPPPDRIPTLCDSIALDRDKSMTDLYLRIKVLSESSYRCLARALSTNSRITKAQFLETSMGPRCMAAFSDQLMRAYSDDKHQFVVLRWRWLTPPGDQLGYEGIEVLTRLLCSGILPHLKGLRHTSTLKRPLFLGQRHEGARFDVHFKDSPSNGRSSTSRETSARGNILVYARCQFHSSAGIKKPDSDQVRGISRSSFSVFL